MTSLSNPIVLKVNDQGHNRLWKPMALSNVNVSEGGPRHVKYTNI